MMIEGKKNGIDKKAAKKTAIHIGILAILMAATLAVVFRNNDLGKTVELIKTFDLRFLGLAFLAMFAYIGCEGYNIFMVLKSFKYPAKYISCFRYAITGFFFSSVTPSASGGQPVQLYYMSKDNVKTSHGALTLLVVTATYQLVVILMVVLASFMSIETVIGKNPIVFKLILLGSFMNLLVLTSVLIAMFSKKTALAVSGRIFSFMKKRKIKRAETWQGKVEGQIDNYNESAQLIKGNKILLVKVACVTFLQLLAIHSIPFIIYKGFGYDGYGYLTVLSFQLLLYISTSTLPLPGAVGASEGAFLAIYSFMYSKEMISSAMLLSRGVSFYAFLVISGLVVLGWNVMSIVKAKDKHTKDGPSVVEKVRAKGKETIGRPKETMHRPKVAFTNTSNMSK